MQTMFTGLSENGEILNESHKIRLLFKKVQNPILTQIKESLQVSHDMYQSKKVTYEFISNSLEAEAASLRYQTPEESQMSTLVTREHQRAASREQMTQYSAGFTPIGPIYCMKRKIYL